MLHTFPYSRRLPQRLQSAVRRLREDAQRLLERPPRRVQICLCLWVLRVALRVKLIAPGADDRRREHLPNSGEQVRSKVGDRGRREAELAGRGF